MWMQRRNSGIGNAMKIYLLMLLIGALLTAIHFTAPPSDSRRGPAQQ
jgi:hypothetical protein